MGKQRLHGQSETHNRWSAQVLSCWGVFVTPSLRATIARLRSAILDALEEAE